MDPSIFPTMLSGERWSKQVSTTVALTVQTLYGEVFSAITWYSMAWHGVVGTLTDQTLYGGGSPDICGPGKSALNVGVQCSCPPFKNQMLQNFDKTYCLTSSNGPPLECIESILEVMETRGQTIKKKHYQKQNMLPISQEWWYSFIYLMMMKYSQNPGQHQAAFWRVIRCLASVVYLHQWSIWGVWCAIGKGWEGGVPSSPREERGAIPSSRS